MFTLDQVIAFTQRAWCWLAWAMRPQRGLPIGGGPVQTQHFLPVVHDPSGARHESFYLIVAKPNAAQVRLG